MQRDPRADAIEELFGQQGVARPGMKTEEDLRRFEEEKIPPMYRGREMTPEDALREKAYSDHLRSYDTMENYTPQIAQEAYEGDEDEANAFIRNFGLEPFKQVDRELKMDPHELTDPNYEYVPMPRPRYPDITEDASGPLQQDTAAIIEQGATLRKQDVNRMRDPKGFGKENPEKPFGYEDPLADEDLLRLIQEGLAPKDMTPKRKRR
jgi:hypothetical protein